MILDLENIHESSRINLGLKKISRIKEGSSKDRSLKMDRPGVLGREQFEIQELKQMRNQIKVRCGLERVHINNSGQFLSNQEN